MSQASKMLEPTIPIMQRTTISSLHVQQADDTIRVLHQNRILKENMTVIIYIHINTRHKSQTLSNCYLMWSLIN